MRWSMIGAMQCFALVNDGTEQKGSFFPVVLSITIEKDCANLFISLEQFWERCLGLGYWHLFTYFLTLAFCRQIYRLVQLPFHAPLCSNVKVAVTKIELPCTPYTNFIQPYEAFPSSPCFLNFLLCHKINSLLISVHAAFSIYSCVRHPAFAVFRTKVHLWHDVEMPTKFHC